MGALRALYPAAEAEGLVGSSAVTPADAADHAPCCADAATGVFPADLHGLRRRFPEQWASFLRSHFQGATHVAAFFGVDDHTARGWLNGRPSGGFVVAAVKADPQAMEILGREE